MRRISSEKGVVFSRKRLTFDEKCNIFYMNVIGDSRELLFKVKRVLELEASC